ncbi:MAG: hypothetical protein WA709_30765, partial [Stellaceae bacterium]
MALVDLTFDVRIAGIDQQPGLGGIRHQFANQAASVSFKRTGALHGESVVDLSRAYAKYLQERTVEPNP